jgi:predicted anti-sigma-YlaC factor YlaD
VETQRIDGTGGIECAHARQLLTDYMDGDLDAATEELVNHHLVTCANCRAVLDGLRNVVTLLGQLTEFDLPSELRNPGSEIPKRKQD